MGGSGPDAVGTGNEHVLISSMGGFVCVDGKEDEIIISAIADGVALAGWAVTVVNSTGVIEAVDVNGSTDRFIGFLLPHYKTDVDTLIAAGELVEIVIPQRGHTYIVWIADPAGTVDVGVGMTFSATDGAMVVDESTAEVRDTWARLNKFVVSTDKFAEVTWN